MMRSLKKSLQFSSSNNSVQSTKSIGTFTTLPSLKVEIWYYNTSNFPTLSSINGNANLKLRSNRSILLSSSIELDIYLADPSMSVYWIICISIRNPMTVKKKMLVMPPISVLYFDSLRKVSSTLCPNMSNYLRIDFFILIYEIHY